MPRARALMRRGCASRLRTAASRSFWRTCAATRSRRPREQFENGGKDFAAALGIESAYGLRREPDALLPGRALIFPDRANQKDYSAAATLLERAIRLDSDRAYSYNALGIAYLEQAPQSPAFFSQAIAALHDAIRRARTGPIRGTTSRWRSPNVAIMRRPRPVTVTPSLSRRSIPTCRTTWRFCTSEFTARTTPMRTTNMPSQLRAMRTRRASFRTPADGSPEEAEANNALGTLAEEDRNRSEARRYYRKALELDPASLSARENLARLATPMAAARPKPNSFGPRI